jgi:NitT/TauT family transport system permease protein
MKGILKSRFFLRSVFVLLLVAAWHGLALAKIWPEYLLPGPLSVVEAIVDGVMNQHYLGAISMSFKRLLIGYAISVFSGVFLGFSLARWQLVEDTLGGIILGLQTLPSICWLPLAILWFGLRDSAIVFVVVMGSLLSVTLATKAAVTQVPVLFIRAGRTMGASGATLLFQVILPAALPGVLEGAKQAWSFAWRSLLAAELLFVTTGLGHLLNMGRELNDMSQVMAVMVMIVAIGFLSDQVLFRLIERRMAKVRGFAEQE